MTRATQFHLELVSDLLRWRAFVAIGELGSLTRAALFLDTTHSMLSRQLNALERECGARLFNRTGRGVNLTDVGQCLLPEVRDLLANAQSLGAHIRGDAQQPAGQVSLGIVQSISSTLVSRLYGSMKRDFPGIRLKVIEGTSSDLEAWLADGQVDMAVLYRFGVLRDAERPLAWADTYLVGPIGDPVTRSPEVPFSALDGLPLILPSSPNALRTVLDAAARREQIELCPALELNSLSATKSLVATERLYTALSGNAVWAELVAGQLQASKIVNPSLRRAIVLANPKSKGAPRPVAAVTSKIVELVGEAASSGMWSLHSGSVTPKVADESCVSR